jgi:hypothetical protein
MIDPQAVATALLAIVREFENTANGGLSEAGLRHRVAEQTDQPDTIVLIALGICRGLRFYHIQVDSPSGRWLWPSSVVPFDKYTMEDALSDAENWIEEE